MAVSDTHATENEQDSLPADEYACALTMLLVLGLVDVVSTGAEALGPAKRANRHASTRAAFEKHPDRFVHGEPKLASVPEAVWINKPIESDQAA